MCEKPDMLLADKASQEAYADGLKRLAGADQSARIAELESDKARLDFILAKYRKVVCERLSTGSLMFYVEEGFMADRCYPGLILSGDASANAEKRAAAQRKAIDIAMQEARGDVLGAQGVASDV